MFRFIKFLFTGDWHLHEWEIIGRGRLTTDDSLTGYYYHLQCKKCGKVKTTKCEP